MTNTNTNTHKMSLASLILGILCLLSALVGGSADAVTFSYKGAQFCTKGLNIDATGVVGCASSGTPGKSFNVASLTPCSAGLLIKAPIDSTAPSEVGCAKTLPDNCQLDVTPNRVVAPGETVTLTASSCSNPPSSYKWSASAGLAAANAPIDTATSQSTTTVSLPSSAASGYYFYTVMASNDAGAGSTATAVIKVAAAAQYSPYAYIPSQVNAPPAPGIVKVIDASTNSIVGSPIAVGINPLGVAVSSDWQRVYVTNSGSHNVSVIDTTKNIVTATIDVGDYPFGVVVKPDGSKVYVANSVSNSVSVIDTANNNVITVAVGSRPQGMAVKPDGTRIYVANNGSQGVSVIDTASNKIVGILPTDSGPYGVAVNPTGTRIYVTNSVSNTVQVFDAASNTLIKGGIYVGTSPHGIAINPTGTLAYVANNVSGTISVIDIDASHTATVNTIIATLNNVGASPESVAFHPAGYSAYVINSGAGTVTTLDVASGVALGFTPSVGGHPYALGQFIGPALVSPQCTLIASPAAISAGGSSTLTASCTPAASSYVWTGDTCAGTSASSCTVTPSAATTYTVTGSNAAGSSTMSSATVTVNTAAATPYTGLWWNPTEPGWGMSVTQHGNMIFAVPYTYDSTGQPTWYVMSSCPIVTAGSCTGELYKVSGGTSPAVPWNEAGKGVTLAGTGMLTFDDASHGKFTYILNGVHGSKTIEKQPFSNGTAQFAVDYTDLWWNPNESGWGVALTQDHGMIFAAWYAYTDNGEAIWYVASSCPLSTTSSVNGCSGDLYKVTGGSPLTATWNGAVKPVATGSVTFNFSDANNGLMSYTINGVPKTRIITRQPF